MKPHRFVAITLFALALSCGGAAAHKPFQDSNMDFGSIKSVVVLPFSNLTRDSLAGERVREVLSTMLLATGAVYVIPPGEVMRGVMRLGMTDPRSPTVEEVVKLGTLLKADAVIRGVVKEYGEVRSGSSAANVVSVQLEMYETSTGKVVWAAASTKGGVGWSERLLGGGGAPINDTTEQVADDLINKLFK
jgi:polysaccharide biosynthesis protein PelC